MKLSLLFARRYLLAKRSRNAVNIITLISIVVIAVVTCAMVVVLSTLNGIADLVDTLYSPFDQDLTITATEGKTFPRDGLDLPAIQALPGVERTSWVIEENVLLRSGDQQAVATMKGVEPQYLLMSGLAGHMYSGEARLGDTGNGSPVILGAALKDELGVPLDDGVMRPLEIGVLVRGRKLSRLRDGAFEQHRAAVSGAFTINLEFDQQYLVAPIALAADMLHYGDDVNALEVQTRPGTAPRLAEQVRKALGPAYTVRTRHEKNALMYRTNATEKWFTFTVLAFIGLIGGFNIIASLTLMMIEKQQDMRTLSGMGATTSFVRNVFFLEGMLIVVVGTVAGLAVGLLICGLQQWTGMVSLQDSVVESYPVKVLWTDIGLIFLAVMAIGTIAARVPLRGLSRRYLANA